MKSLLQRLTQKHPRLYEIAKFLLVGGTATLIDMLVMAVVIYLFCPAIYDGFFGVFLHSSRASTTAVVVGTAMGFGISVIFNYIFSVIFVFSRADTTSARSRRGFVLFVLLAIGGLAIHMLGMYVGYDLLAINEWLLKVCLTLVVLIYNYLSRKKLLFDTPAPSQMPEPSSQKNTPAPPKNA